VSDVLSLYEQKLEIPVLEQSLIRMKAEQAQIDQDLNTAAGGLRTGEALQRLDLQRSDLEANIKALDRVIESQGLKEPYVSQRASDVAMLERVNAKRDLIFTLSSKSAAKSGEMIPIQSDLVGKQSMIQASKSELELLGEDQLIKVSTLSEKLSWLVEIITAVADKK
jgi:hypothetical protein